MKKKHFANPDIILSLSHKEDKKEVEMEPFFNDIMTKIVDVTAALSSQFKERSENSLDEFNLTPSKKNKSEENKIDIFVQIKCILNIQTFPEITICRVYICQIFDWNFIKDRSAFLRNPVDLIAIYCIFFR